MADLRSEADVRRTDRLIILGIPVLFAVGSLAHFIYGWTGKAVIAGIFTPVNESVWEHLKMTFWPVLIWWIAAYFTSRRRKEIPAGRWFTACAAAILVCPVIICAFFYTYTGALGIEFLTLDIISMLLGISAAQGVGLHVMKYARVGTAQTYVSFAILILIAAAFTVFTFVTPQFPLFKDPSTGLFGLGN